MINQLAGVEGNHRPDAFDLVDVPARLGQRLAEQGPTAEELENAKSYLTGAYALRFESSSSIANQLLWIQIEELGIDYVNQRNKLVEAVTLDDIKRVARRLIEADRLITTIVGKPVATKSAGAPG